ncbi:hypothetical protein TNCV_3369431 [Trichonephila clavipes]|uniref:Uncharacterized protein n=1 Tax=Trichonephila clavipes TaxID=2585209 RepID=A0A8X6UTR8_TRICX|nr:hypothetical protein TNCV_3369431 [Trichonephila clavipes]
MKCNAQTTCISTIGVATTRCNKCCYTMWHGIPTDIECLLEEDCSPYCLYVEAKVRLLKQDTDHQANADQPHPIRAQLVTYPVNRQAKGSCMCWAEQKSRTVFATCEPNLRDDANVPHTHMDKGVFNPPGNDIMEKDETVMTEDISGV